jgi:hypothetical protein
MTPKLRPTTILLRTRVQHSLTTRPCLMQQDSTAHRKTPHTVSQASHHRVRHITKKRPSRTAQAHIKGRGASKPVRTSSSGSNLILRPCLRNDQGVSLCRSRRAMSSLLLAMAMVRQAHNIVTRLSRDTRRVLRPRRHTSTRSLCLREVLFRVKARSIDRWVMAEFMYRGV